MKRTLWNCPFDRSQPLAGYCPGERLPVNRTRGELILAFLDYLLYARSRPEHVASRGSCDPHSSSGRKMLPLVPALVSQGSHNTVSPAGWLEQQTLTVSQSSSWKSETKVLAGCGSF